MEFSDKKFEEIKTSAAIANKKFHKILDIKNQVRSTINHFTKASLYFFSKKMLNLLQNGESPANIISSIISFIIECFQKNLKQIFIFISFIENN